MVPWFEKDYGPHTSKRNWGVFPRKHRKFETIVEAFARMQKNRGGGYISQYFCHRVSLQAFLVTIKRRSSIDR